MTILLMVGTLFPQQGGVGPSGPGQLPDSLPFFVTFGQLKSF